MKETISTGRARIWGLTLWVFATGLFGIVGLGCNQSAAGKKSGEASAEAKPAEEPENWWEQYDTITAPITATDEDLCRILLVEERPGGLNWDVEAEKKWVAVSALSNGKGKRDLFEVADLEHMTMWMGRDTNTIYLLRQYSEEEASAVSQELGQNVYKRDLKSGKDTPYFSTKDHLPDWEWINGKAKLTGGRQTHQFKYITYDYQSDQLYVDDFWYHWAIDLKTNRKFKFPTYSDHILPLGSLRFLTQYHSSKENKQLALIDIKQGKVLRSFEGRDSIEIDRMSVTPDGKLIMSWGQRLLDERGKEDYLDFYDANLKLIRRVEFPSLRFDYSGRVDPYGVWYYYLDWTGIRRIRIKTLMAMEIPISHMWMNNSSQRVYPVQMYTGGRCRFWGSFTLSPLQ